MCRRFSLVNDSQQQYLSFSVHSSDKNELIDICYTYLEKCVNHHGWDKSQDSIRIVNDRFTQMFNYVNKNDTWINIYDNFIFDYEDVDAKDSQSKSDSDSEIE